MGNVPWALPASVYLSTRETALKPLTRRKHFVVDFAALTYSLGFLTGDHVCPREVLRGAEARRVLARRGSTLRCKLLGAMPSPGFQLIFKFS